MRANEDMMPKLSICHGHGSKMNFSVSDYIRGDTAHLVTLYYLCSTHPMNSRGGATYKDTRTSPNHVLRYDKGKIPFLGTFLSFTLIRS